MHFMFLKRGQLEEQCFEKYQNKKKLFIKCIKDVDKKLEYEQTLLQYKYIFHEKHMEECLDNAEDGEMFE